MRRPALRSRLLGLALASWIASGWALGGCATARSPLELGAMASVDGYEFSPTELVAPPGTPLTVMFQNPTDAPHTLIFLGPINRDAGAPVQPGGSARVDFVAPMRPDTYRFVCNVHEGMDGVLVVQ